MTLVKFSDVIHLSSTRTADPASAGIDRFVGLEHIEPENLHIRSWGLVADGTTFTNTFKRGQVLFGKRRAYQRKVAVADFDGVCSSDIYVFESKDPNVLLPELVPFILQSEGFYDYAVKTSAGSLSPRTNWTHLANYEFPLPPVDEQRRIADLLWAADDAVIEWNKSLESLDRLYEAYLEDSFSLAQSTGTFHDIDEICKEVTVGIVVNPSKYYADSGVIAISHSNIFRGEIDTSGAAFITNAAHQSLKKSWLYTGDIVLPRVSTIAGRPYYAAVVPNELNEINAIGIIILRPDSEKVNPYYLEACLNAQSTRRRLVGVAVGSIQRQLNVGIIAKEKIPVLPFEKQNKIAEKSKTFKINIDQMKKHLEKQISLKRQLLASQIG